MGSPKTLSKRQILDTLNRGESLSGADMRSLDLSGVCFDGADLSYAKLANCNLARATFRGANLSGTSLWHADCKDAVFDEALLEESDFDFTNLDGSTFRAARVKKTIFPNLQATLAEVRNSVRTGKKIRLDRRSSD